jgi:hypothetical protein
MGNEVREWLTREKFTRVVQVRTQLCRFRYCMIYVLCASHFGNAVLEYFV